MSQYYIDTTQLEPGYPAPMSDDMSYYNNPITIPSYLPEQMTTMPQQMYTQPMYTQPTYVQPTYVQPTYTYAQPTYTYAQPTYVQPSQTQVIRRTTTVEEPDSDF
jgi:hypothetical protein